jgi:glycosyltransferase involved in cell wall biosynthesis
LTREELIRCHFSHSMHLLEMGPSHSPILPKAEGWQTTIVDHAAQADLVAKYTAMGVATASRIEPVDFIWQDGPLTALIPQAMHGSYDGLVASHVGEHLPDLIAFFQDASALMRPNGVMALALPDKRVCFDFFQPLTTTGDLVAAHVEGRTRHQRRTFFNQAAYFVTRNNEGGWAHTGNTVPLCLANPLSQAQQAYDAADEGSASDYRDSHAWTFTPKSFELLILELNLLGHINWTIRAIEAAPGVEFYVWLEQKRIAMPEAAINPLRLSLLTAMIYETMDSIAQLDEAPAPASAPTPNRIAGSKTAKLAPKRSPSIAVIIPLYNGARYIEQALNSVFKQTLPATEVIVVNDGSTDDGDGIAVVERLAQTHPLTLLHKSNGGQSSARNLGVRQSKSDLIAFLDQDDLWYDNHLQELVKPFLVPFEPVLGWVYSDLDEIDQNGFLICRSFLSTIPVVHPKRNIFDCIRQDMYILPSASLICRKAFEAVGGFDEQLCGYEDDDLFMRMFRLGYDNIYIERALSQWRIYSGSTSYTHRMVLSRNIYMHKLQGMFPDDILRDRYYVRDMIVPRFFDLAMRDYQAAVLLGDPDAIAAAWNALLPAQHNDDMRPRLLEYALDHYGAALLRGDEANIESVWNEIIFLARQSKDAPPRLLQHSLDRYRAALFKGGEARIGAAWEEATEVVALMPQRRRLRRTLNFLRNPTVAKSAFALRRFVRPAMLWAFR